MPLRDALKNIPFVRPAVRALRRQSQARARDQAWAAYAAAEPVPRLDIGTSERILPGWFSVDVQPFYAGQYFMDAKARFPFADASFAFVRSEHMIEHVPFGDGMQMLRECYRVLKPGGVVRIATPDLRKLARLYDDPPTPAQQAYRDAICNHARATYGSDQPGVVINHMYAYEGHDFIYDSGTLGEGLRKAGFIDVVESAPGVSSHPIFAGTDTHVGADDWVTFETLTMEARKR
jgi:SAM-dependent methyltransferase